jgi:putative ABC transport system permease protein
MTGLALRSLRHRRSAFLATFLAALLGTALIGSFAALIGAATGPVSADDRSTLIVLGSVVGAWGALIVLFSVASTAGVAVAQRQVEIGLLRTLGATPRQVRRLVRAEVAVVGLVACVLGALVAAGTGRLLLGLLRGGLVGGDVQWHGAGPTLAVTAAGVLAVSLLAASVAGRRASAGPAMVVLREGRAGGGRLHRWRIALAVLLLAYGIGAGVVTVTVTGHDPDPYAAMQTSGSSCLLVGIGLALLAPVLLRWLSRPAAVLRGPAGWLAARTARTRPWLLSGVLGPVIVMTAGAIGVLMLVGIDRRTQPAGPGPEQQTIALLNNVVTAMICAFAAIMVVNSFAAAVAHRRAELHRLWLLGATPDQVRRSVLAEAGIVAAVGVVLGTVASLATVVPFGLARHEGLVPDGELWLPPLLVAAVVGVTLLAAWAAVRSAPVGAVPRGAPVGGGR